MSEEPNLIKEEQSKDDNVPIPKSAMSDDNDWDKVDDDIPQTSNEGTEAPATDTDTDAAIPTATNTTVTEDNSEDKVAATPEPASAHQIVSIGTESDQYAFTFHEETLSKILKQIPSDKKVCVVSVVGAFRTGKSFLLSWFLKYLNHHESMSSSTTPTDQNENEKDEGKKGGETKWYGEESDSTLGQNGFHWRGGAERNTTGIWMWSKPFFLPRTNTTTGKQEDIAVLLVDTQGMFDHETTMGLTAAIFGLSTLLSSYQIYNVDKRIQEDNLQQLALFSEYGRMAIQTEGKEKLEFENKAKTASDLIKNIEDKEDGEKQVTEEEEKSLNESTTADDKPKPKPFQHIEFLVRDWQNFDDEDDTEACERDMVEYLEKVLAEREASDLKDTREQITSCFENVACYLMPHPGKAVTKKTYGGEINTIDTTFVGFMDRYCSKVFENLVAKSINGRELTAMELGAYLRNYAKMFETGATFPEAATMLEATSNANNTNALNLTIKKYKEEMDSVAGTDQTNYMNPVLLNELHRTLLTQSMRGFDEVACFGNKKAISEVRSEALRTINENFDVYTKLNESRNPLAGFET
jgi:atlastin